MDQVPEVIERFLSYANRCIEQAQKLESHGDVLMGSVYETVGGELTRLVIRTANEIEETVSAHE